MGLRLRLARLPLGVFPPVLPTVFPTVFPPMAPHMKQLWEKEAERHSSECTRIRLAAEVESIVRRSLENHSVSIAVEDPRGLELFCSEFLDDVDVVYIISDSGKEEATITWGRELCKKLRDSTKDPDELPKK